MKKTLLLLLVICFLAGCQSKEEKEEQANLANSTLMVKNLSEIRLGNHTYDEIAKESKRYKNKMTTAIYNEWFDTTNPTVQEYLRFPTISMNTIINEYELVNQQFTYNQSVYQYWLVYKGKYRVSEELEEAQTEGRIKVYYYYEFNAFTHKLENTEMEVILDD